MADSSRVGRTSRTLMVSLLALILAGVTFVHAQQSKTKAKSTKPMSAAEVKQIEARLDKLQDTISTEAAAIVDGYERAGQYERAKVLLEVLLKLDPKNESVKARINEMDERILDRSEFDHKLSVGADWMLVGTVRKDSPARVEASGDYKLALPTVSLGPDGFHTSDVMHDVIEQVPFGALMGMIVTEAGKKKKESPEPFTIKAKHEFTPKSDGQLYLKVNVPSNSKCTGELKLRLNGVAR